MSEGPEQTWAGALVGARPGVLAEALAGVVAAGGTCDGDSLDASSTAAAV